MTVYSLYWAATLTDAGSGWSPVAVSAIIAALVSLIATLGGYANNRTRKIAVRGVAVEQTLRDAYGHIVRLENFAIGRGIPEADIPPRPPSLDPRTSEVVG